MDRKTHPAENSGAFADPCQNESYTDKTNQTFSIEADSVPIEEIPEPEALEQSEIADEYGEGQDAGGAVSEGNQDGKQKEKPNGKQNGKEETAPISKRARFGQIVKVLNKYKAFQGITPAKLRMILEDLGPTYVKLGQIMSSRRDLIDADYCSELEKLRSAVEPMPYETVVAIVEEAYGKPIDQVFKFFSKDPIGSASMAQVHQAVTFDDQDVVVKVQRPHLYAQMEVDVEMLRRAARLLKLDKSISSIVDLDTVIDEFWNTAKEEMDFSREAANCERFGKAYQDWKFIGVPKIYDGYTCQNILVMSDIHGVEIDNYPQLAKEGYSRKEIAVKLAENYIDQVVEQGFFHADPHSGNIRIENGKIVWLDFGMMGELSERDREQIGKAIQAAAVHDTSKLTDAILAIGITKGDIDYPGFSNTLEQFMDRYLSSSLQTIDLAQMAGEMIDICHKYQIALPKGITMLGRSLITMEGTMSDLDPSVDMLSILAKEKSGLADLDLNKTFKDLLVKLVQASSQSLSIPVEANQVLKLLRKGQLKISLNLLDLPDLLPDLNKMVDRLVICILIAALLMGSSIVCTTNLKPKFLGIPLIGLTGFMISFCLSVWLFFKMLWRRNKDTLF